MKAFSLAWLLGWPVRGCVGPQVLTASAYALTAALLMLVAAGILLLPLVGVAMVLSPLTRLIVLGTLAAGVVAVRASLTLAGARLVLHTS